MQEENSIFNRLIEIIKQLPKKLFNKSLSIGVPVAVQIAIQIFLIWISILIYIILYYYLVPKVVYYQEPLYFNFGHENIKPSARQSFESIDVFRRGIEYDIKITLELPESDPNKQQGMFMIVLQLLNENNIIANFTRPCILRFKSSLLSTMETIFYSLPLVFGYSEEKQILNVDMSTPFYNLLEKEVTEIRVQLSATQIQIYSALLHINTRLSGIKYYMYKWFIPTSIIGVSVIYFIVEIVYIIYRFSQPKTEIITERETTITPKRRPPSEDRTGLEIIEREGKGQAQDFNTLDGLLETSIPQKEDDEAAGILSSRKDRGKGKGASSPKATTIDEEEEEEEIEEVKKDEPEASPKLGTSTEVQGLRKRRSEKGLTQ